MSNLLTDIFKSHLDLNKNKTISKSTNSGILENKVSETFSVFNEKTGSVKVEEFLETFFKKEKKNPKEIKILESVGKYY